MAKNKSLLNAFHAAALGVTLFAASVFSAGPAVASESIDVGATRQQPPITEETLPTYSNVLDDGRLKAVSYASLAPHQPRVDVLTDRAKNKTDVVITETQRERARVFTTLVIRGKGYPYCVDIGFDGRVLQAVTGQGDLDRSIRQLGENPPDLDAIKALVEKTKSVASKAVLSSREGPMETVSAPFDPSRPENDLLLSGIKTEGRETQVREVVDYNRGRQLRSSTVVVTTLFKHKALQDGLPLTITIKNGQPPLSPTGILVEQIETAFKKEGRTVAPNINSRDYLTVLTHCAEAAARVMTADFESIAYQKPIAAPVSAAAFVQDMDALFDLTQERIAQPAVKPVKQPEKPAAPQKKTTTNPKVEQVARLTR